MFCASAVQSAWLAIETWTFPKAMSQALEHFHHQAAQRMAGDMPQKEGGTWMHPPLDGALADAGLCSIHECVNRHQVTMVQHGATRPIHSIRSVVPPRVVLARHLGVRGGGRRT